jgi:hypothetical protein
MNACGAPERRPRNEAAIRSRGAPRPLQPEIRGGVTAVPDAPQSTCLLVHHPCSRRCERTRAPAQTTGRKEVSVAAVDIVFCVRACVRVM